MTILVLSDLHGREERVRAVLDRHGRADYLFFLGDGYLDAHRALNRTNDPPFVGVRGNCDAFFCDAPEEMTLDLDGVRFFLHHGHTTSVKHGFGGLISAARRTNADVCLFGHTHEPHLSYEASEGKKPFYLFNPGSIGKPYDGIPRFGVITVRGGAVLLSHGTLD